MADDTTARSQAERIVAALSAGAWVRVQARIQVRGRRPVPPPVEETVLRAAAEALRNVHAHAGVDRAEVRLRLDPSGIDLSVADRGHGLVPAATEGAAAGWGLGGSVVRPLAEAGGGAEIRHRDGGGTMVRLTWRHPRRPDTATRMRSTYEATVGPLGATRLLRRVAMPCLVAYLTLALWLGVDEAHPFALLTVAALQAGALLAVVRTLRRRALRPLDLLVVLLVQVATTSTALMLGEDGALRTYESWAVGLGALPLLVAAYTLPVELAALGMLAGVGTVTVGVLLDPTVAPGAALGSFVAVLLPSYSVMLGVFQRRAMGRLLAERARGAEAAIEAERQAILAETAERHLSFTLAEVTPWLEAIAAGQHPVRSPETSGRARLYAVEARDDLCAPGFYDDALRAAARAFRARGGSLDIDPDFPPGAYRRTSGTLVRAAIAAEPPATKIRIRALGPLGRLIVTPPMSGSALARCRRALPDNAIVEVLTDEVGTVIDFADTPSTGGPADAVHPVGLSE